MKDFIRETLETYGAYKTSDLIGSFEQDDKIRVVARHTYDKTVTTARIIAEEHFYYLKTKLNEEKYNVQVLIFIGTTPMWGFYKRKFANFGTRNSGVDNSMIVDLNMKAISNGYERMNEEEIERFEEVYKAYANCDIDFFSYKI